MKKPEEPKKTGSRSYDSFKQKKYESELKEWEKEQAKKGIQNDAAVKAAQKKQASAERRVDELTSIGSLDASDALAYQSKDSSKKFKFENVLDDIKANANNVYEQRRKQDLPGKLGSRSGSGGYRELRDKIKTISKEAGIDYREFYTDPKYGSKLTGGIIGKNQKLRIKAGTDDEFEPVDTSKDVYGLQSISDLENKYKHMPSNLRGKEADALTIVQRAPQAMGAGIAASNVKAKIPSYKSAYKKIGL